MAAPALVAVATTWTKVATNVTTGRLRPVNSAPKFYLVTYALTGGAAPTDDTTAIQINTGEFYTFPPYGAAADVYVRSVGDAGSVIVET